ncbi:hypothetical protein ASG67_15505 [Sphingomonas sp. Leaf339]|uniref:glycosyltransferase n=1 Tax=Sphingomonas sp. Leaf339 TaxID=1736343 RepID=UPI0006F9FB21|nr:glycosyltransferase [Sphingomonas sp. Leaf339]KQU46010.1 hypothetical protein ASG67_15505 [Sphingomonas sp. Leaf339]
MLSDSAPPPEKRGSVWTVDPATVSVVIPVLNAEPFLIDLLPALARQGLPHDRFLVLDSQSRDRSAAAFREFGATVVEIEQASFNHGGTRQRAVEMRPLAEYVVMLTQDAIPQGDGTIARLVSAFADPAVGMAYGRQLPRPMAQGIERHARLFNYPPVSETREFADRQRRGAKVVFCSDSFAAYRTKALADAGGFPKDAFFAEDQLVAGRMLMKNWKITYRGDAEVVHSHDYSIAEEFRRYFDVGVFHGRNRWLLDTYGRVEGEGMRFARSEMAYLARHDPWRLPTAGIRLLAKYAGYKIGAREASLSNAWKMRLSMQPFYWRRQQP